MAIILMVAGSISFIASSAIIYHISRAHKWLSTTYHRLMFGLCIADMMSSLAYAPSTTVTPKETNYVIPVAFGNLTTCRAQGFVGSVGYIDASL